MRRESLMQKSPCARCSEAERRRFREVHNTDCCKSVCESYKEFLPLLEADGEKAREAKRKERLLKDYTYESSTREYKRNK